MKNNDRLLTIPEIKQCEDELPGLPVNTRKVLGADLHIAKIEDEQFIISSRLSVYTHLIDKEKAVSVKL